MNKKNPTSPTSEDIEKASYSYDVDDADLSLKAGTYAALCTDVEETTSNSGNPQLKMEFKLVTENNRTMNMWVSLLPSARWKLVATLKAFGIEPVEGKIKFEPEDLIDQLVSAKVIMDDYSGVEQPKLNAVFPATREQLLAYSGKPG